MFFHRVRSRFASCCPSLVPSVVIANPPLFKSRNTSSTSRGSLHIWLAVSFGKVGQLFFSNVRRNFPLLLYLSLIGDSDTDVSKVESLCDRFTRTTDSLAEEAGKTGSQEDRIQAVKNIEFTLRGINRALDFGKQRDSTVSQVLLENLRPQLTNVVSNLYGVSRNGRIEKERRKLADRL